MTQKIIDGLKDALAGRVTMSRRMWAQIDSAGNFRSHIMETKKLAVSFAKIAPVREVTVTWSTPSKRKQRKSKTGK